MSAAPTPAEITSEITALKDLATKVRRWSAFGDDNKEAILTQIDVLEESMDEDRVYTRFGEDSFLDPGEFSQHILDNALQAVTWLEKGGKAMSDQWRPLCSG